MTDLAYEPLLTALIVAISAAISPVVVAIVTSRQRRKEKHEDYARQDAVAARAEIARLSQEQNARHITAAVVTNSSKLDEIHGLVNSNLTAVKRAMLDGMIRECAMLREIMALTAAAGRAPEVETVNALAATEASVAELQAEIRERLQTLT